MADNSKVAVSAVVSANTDYSDPYVRTTLANYTATPDEALVRRVQVDTSDTTIDLAPWASISSIIIKNTDSTNYVLPRLRVIKASVTYGADELGWTTGPPGTMTDSTNVLLSSLYFKAGDYCLSSGTDEAGNSGTFLVQAAAAGTLTFGESESIALDPADAGTPTITSLAQVEDKLSAGQFGIYNNVQPAGDLILVANTAAVTCDIIIIGS